MKNDPKQIISRLNQCRSCGRVQPIKVWSTREGVHVVHWCRRRSKRSPEITVQVRYAANATEAIASYNTQQKPNAQIPYKTHSRPLDIIDDVEQLAQTLREQATTIAQNHPGRIVARRKLEQEATRWESHAHFLNERLQRDIAKLIGRR